MIRPIVKDIFFLQQPSVLATKADMAVAQDLIDTLKANEARCVGLAANMIGVNKQIIVCATPVGPLVMFNPKIVKKEGPFETEEGCLSLVGVRSTTRFSKIEVVFFDREFKKQRMTFTGFTAQIIQHEIDHCQGILI